MSAVRTDWREVQIRTSTKSGRAYFAGLMACGSVWVCPVCATKIQQVRAEEVRSAIASWNDQGGAAALLTLTVPHDRHDVLATLKADFTRALGELWKERRWSELRERFGIFGTIRNLETTWGEASGWHPHSHVLLFVAGGTDLAQLADDLFPVWQRVVARRGLGAVSRAAFSLQDGTHVSRYVTKMSYGADWGPAEELVRGHTKSASGLRFSPFDLLGEVVYGEHDRPTVWRYQALFREFAAAFHGTRQLQWSKGLKRALLGTEGLTDEEVADSIGEADPVLIVLNLEQWQAVRRGNLQGDVLLIAELHGADGVRHFLVSLQRPAPTLAVPA